MRPLLFLSILTGFFGSPALAAEGPIVFRFHLVGEPHVLDPQSSSSSSGNYLAQNLFRGLMKYDDDKGLLPEGAEKCEMSGLKVTCQIAKTHKWSNGDPVRAEDYVRSFRRLLDAHRKSPQAELLMTIQNAREVWKGVMSPETLGVEAVDEKTLIVKLAVPDSDFLRKLANVALSPVKSVDLPDRLTSEKMLVTGPYRVKKWKAGDRVTLEANPHYPGGADRPPAEALFIEEDSTALGLYDVGTLSFLRRLPSPQIEAYRSHPDFFRVPLSRFDYIGFSRRLKDYPKLRRALSTSLDFKQFFRLFSSATRPGCPSLQSALFEGTVCVDYGPLDAKKLIKEQGWPKDVKTMLGLSLLGGDDIQRQAEWFQGQWKKNLGLEVELNSQEQGVYLARLKTDPPALFRKGIGLDRPSCLAALEIFSRDNPENYIRLDIKEYDQVVEQLRSETNTVKARALCSAGLKILIQQNWIIPLGQMYFTMLMDPHFLGWKINSLNQLDLSNLHYRK